MKKAIVVLLILSLFLVGCSNVKEEEKEGIESSVTTITAQEAKTRLDNEKDIILVDVRTEEEYQEEHIKDALLLPLDNISENAATVIPDKEAIYFVYCLSGGRSATASEQLLEMGYKNLYDLGGISDWPYEKETE